MNLLLLKSILRLAASSVAIVTIASCDRKGEPSSFNVRGLEPGIGPTKSTGEGRPIHEAPVPPAGPGTSGGTGSGSGTATGDPNSATTPPTDPQKPEDSTPPK